MTEAPAEPAPDDAADESAQAYIMPNAGPLAVAQSGTGGTGDDAATDVAEAAEDAPVAATAAVAANPATTETRVGAKQQLLAACQAAEHWLQAELDRPGETRPDDILRVLRAAIERAEGQRKVRETRQPGQSRPSNRRPRESSKEAMLIEMLRRPEGATIAQIMAATGWQAHTCPRGLRRRAEKEARPDRHLGEARRRRARLPSPRLTRTPSTSRRTKEKPPERSQGAVRPAVRLGDERQILSGALAIAARYQFVANALTFVQASQPGPLDGGDVHECIGLAIVRLDEAKALGRVEPLHDSGVQVSCLGVER